MSQTKILLVDDEIEFASALAERLQLRSYIVKIANNALEALDFTQNHFPDVIILDLKIPGMDAIKTLKSIKKIDPTIEVIILTGHGDVQSIEEVLKGGAFEYIIKPVDIGELTAKIDDAMKKKNRAQ